MPPDWAAVTDPPALRAMLRDGVQGLRGARREALARYALVVYAAQQPRLQASLARWRDDIVRASAPVFAALGASDAELAARVYVAGADGILLHVFSAPSGDLDARLDAVLDALIDAALTISVGTRPRRPRRSAGRG
ncbi:MAG: hypothetical protein V9G19_21390 [Tetrasphaera sp.]